MNFVSLVMFRSSDGKTRWKPVPKDKVPAWIRDDPQVVGRLVGGDMVRRKKGRGWYRAEKVGQQIAAPQPKVIQHA